jgi:hypothetical protein
MTYYATNIHKVDCHKGVTGYQPELVRRNLTTLSTIEGNIYATRAAAENYADKMMAAAEGLFEALDEREAAA